MLRWKSNRGSGRSTLQTRSLTFRKRKGSTSDVERAGFLRETVEN